MKRLLRTFVVGLGFLLPLLVSGAEPIKAGYFTNKPHMYLNDTSGKAQGALVRHFEAVAAKMGQAVEWVGPLPLIRYASYLKAGIIDVGASVVMLPELQDIVYYGAQPVNLARTVFVVRKENPLTRITSIQDVAGYRVGWLANIPPMKFVQEHLAHLRMDYMASSDDMNVQSIRKLLLGRLDAIYEQNAYSLLFSAAELHLQDQLKVLPLPEPPMPVYVGFSQKSPRGRLLAEQYDAARAAMPPFGQADYDKLVQQEFDALP